MQHSMELDLPRSDFGVNNEDEKLYRALAEKLIIIEDPLERIRMFEKMIEMFGGDDPLRRAKILGITFQKLIMD